MAHIILPLVLMSAVVSGCNDQKVNNIINTESKVEQNQLHYLLPQTDKQTLTLEDIEYFTVEELKLAVCEIYARHGVIFSNKDIQSYFEEKEWYDGSIEFSDFNDDKLHTIELTNIDLLRTHRECVEATDEYKHIIGKNDIMGDNGLIDYGNIWAYGFGEGLYDHGMYYEAIDQTLSSPIYFSWNEIKNLEERNLIPFVSYDNQKTLYMIDDVYDEREQEFRIFRVSANGYKSWFCFEDIFDNGKYALVELCGDEPWGYESYDSYPSWDSDIICSQEEVYSGSFYISKDCVVEVVDQEFTIEEVMTDELGEYSNCGFGEHLLGEIVEMNANGIITKIRQCTWG